MNALPALLEGAPATALLRLTIRDFRNLASAELEPPREGMVVIGENGQGKTNLLEAIYYLQLLRSFRGARDADLVRFDTAGFFLSSSLEGGVASEIAVGFEPRGGRRLPDDRDRALALGAAAGRQHDTRAVSGQDARDLEADAARGTRHECTRAAEVGDDDSAGRHGTSVQIRERGFGPDAPTAASGPGIGPRGVPLGTT